VCDGLSGPEVAGDDETGPSRTLRLDHPRVIGTPLLEVEVEGEVWHE
jgi:hypothetical protein